MQILVLSMQSQGPKQLHPQACLESTTSLEVQLSGAEARVFAVVSRSLALCHPYAGQMEDLAS